MTAEAADNPWMKLAGKYKNDPTYGRVLSAIAEYRQALNAEVEMLEREEQCSYEVVFTAIEGSEETPL